MGGNRGKLMAKALAKFGFGFLVIGLILFLCAGSLGYVHGWVFIASIATPMFLFGVFLLIKNPDVLERRLKAKEQDKKQRAIVALSGVQFLASFAVAGLDYRFAWSRMPLVITGIALAAMLAGYMLFVAVLTQNAYASRVVEVHNEQTIITNGLYSIVRHPMYLATLFVFLPMPLILGSWFGMIPLLFYPVILVRRIQNEEALLKNELDGYADYMQKTKYRLLPFIW